MKTLSTQSAAAALGVERKTLDNILAREARRFFQNGRRGRSRRIPISVLERVAVALILNRDLGIPVGRGLELAGNFLAEDSSPIAAGTLTTIAFDVERLRKTLERSVDDALESMAEPIRGRPRA